MSVALRLRLCLLPALLAGACGWAQTPAPASAAASSASPPSSLKAERARIKAERARVAQRFGAEARACHQRFAVNDCLEANRAWQRTALDDLRRQEILLNDGERRRKAAEQLDRLQDKREAQQQDQANRPTEPPREPKAGPRPGGGKLPGEAKPPQAMDPQQAKQYQDTMQRKQERHAQEEARRAEQAAKVSEEEHKYDQRLREAADYKARTLQRHADKASTAKPLPPPP